MNDERFVILTVLDVFSSFHHSKLIITKGEVLVEDFLYDDIYHSMTERKTCLSINHFNSSENLSYDSYFKNTSKYFFFLPRANEMHKYFFASQGNDRTYRRYFSKNDHNH